MSNKINPALVYAAMHFPADFGGGVRYTAPMHDHFLGELPTPFTLPHLYALALDTSIQAGFPSPAEDHAGKRIDVLENLIRHPQATYQMRVKCDSMQDERIFDGDVILIDRAITPRHGHIVVAEIDGEFLVKKLVIRQGRMKLKAGNPTFADIIPKDGQTITIWGVVLTAFKQFQI